MNWTKKHLQNLEKKGKIKSIIIPKKNKTSLIPKSIGKEKRHIIYILEKLCKNEYMEELRFDDKRMFRFDWAIPERKIAIEYEGIFVGNKNQSRHTTLSGYTTDCEKYNLAAKKGWRILRYTAKNHTDIENDLINILNLTLKVI